MISFLIVRHRRRRGAVTILAVDDRLELSPPPSPEPLETSEVQRGEKIGVQVQPTLPEVEIEPQGTHSEGHGLRRANSSVSTASLSRTTVIGSGGSGNETAEGHTRARVHALERAVHFLTTKLGMNDPEVPPPSYASASGHPSQS
jgi:hypothetical protein